jgi:AraC-like DNA-binding protein
VDELAVTLRNGSSLQLRSWAESRGLRPDTVSYVFQREFGVYPKRFRLECRTRLAWHELMRSTCTLTDVAFKVGFSDLAHLSRSIHTLTGYSPSDWRSMRSVSPSAQARRNGKSKESATL